MSDFKAKMHQIQFSAPKTPSLDLGALLLRKNGKGKGKEDEGKGGQGKETGKSEGGKEKGRPPDFELATGLTSFYSLMHTPASVWQAV